MAAAAQRKPRILYLHGLASSPASAKARFIAGRCHAAGLSLQCPDLNCGGFSDLSFSRMLAQTRALIRARPGPVVLIGSSLGGLLAAWCAEWERQVQGLLLLAPAFDLLRHWLPLLPADRRQIWEGGGDLDIHHFATGSEQRLHGFFREDTALFCGSHQLQRRLPTRIVHGRRDAVIHVEASRSFRALRPWVHLLELEADHRLAGVSGAIWQEAQLLLRDLASGPVG